MRRSALNVLLVAAVLAIPWPASGQTPPAAAAPARPTPRISAVRVTAKIAVDGRLDEADWARALPAKDFLQKDPDEGKPATEPTEVRFLYDDDALYVGARMFDSEPSKIAKRLTRRDGDTDGIADRIIVGPRRPSRQADRIDVLGHGRRIHRRRRALQRLERRRDVERRVGRRRVD